MGAHLGRDALALDRPALEQLELARRGEMQHVEPSTMALREPDGLRRRSVARLGRANQRVRLDRHVLSVALAIAFLVLPNQRRVLAVRGDRQARSGEDAVEHGRIVDEHVARRGAHEHFDAARVLGADALDFLEIRVRCAEIKAVVDVARGRGDAALFRERGAIGRRRLRVRHVEEAGDAAA